MKQISMAVTTVLLFGLIAFCAQDAQSISSGPTESRNWRDLAVPIHVHLDVTSAEARKARDDRWARFFSAPQNGYSGTLPVGASRSPSQRGLYRNPLSY